MDKKDAIMCKIMRQQAELAPALDDQQQATQASMQPVLQQQQDLHTTDSLKPFSLSQEHTPEELREWINKFTSYYKVSRMDKLPMDAQITYLQVPGQEFIYERYKVSFFMFKVFLEMTGQLKLLKKNFCQSIHYLQDDESSSKPNKVTDKNILHGLQN